MLGSLLIASGAQSDVWPALTVLLGVVSLFIGSWSVKTRMSAAKAIGSADEWKSAALAREQEAAAWQGELAAMKERLARVEQDAKEANEHARSVEHSLSVLISSGLGPDIGKQILTRLDEIRDLTKQANDALLSEIKKR